MSSDRAALDRAMIDALRELFGLDPLYAARDRSPTAFEEQPPSVGLLEPELSQERKRRTDA